MAAPSSKGCLFGLAFAVYLREEVRTPLEMIRSRRPRYPHPPQRPTPAGRGRVLPAPFSQMGKSLVAE